jgi:hypothetical protein
MHALTFALQSAALTGELSAIENAIVVTIPPDFHTSFLRKLLKAINATSVGTARHIPEGPELRRRRSSPEIEETQTLLAAGRHNNLIAYPRLPVLAITDMV